MLKVLFVMYGLITPPETPLINLIDDLFHYSDICYAEDASEMQLEIGCDMSESIKYQLREQYSICVPEPYQVEYCFQVK